LGGKRKEKKPGGFLKEKRKGKKVAGTRHDVEGGGGGLKL